MICDGCAWAQCREKFQYCEEHKDLDVCPKFWALAKKVCKTCKRNKGSGKCWWCGN